MNKFLNVGIMLFLCGLGSAEAAKVNTPETWPGSSPNGWAAYDVINEIPVWRASSFSVASNALKVYFTAQLDPETKAPTVMPWPPEEYLIKAASGASGGQFTGDYISNGVAAVSFRVYCDTPVQAWVAFASNGSNRWWQYSLGSLATGGWKTVSVPLQPAFFKDLRGSLEWSALEADLRNVSWMGLIIRRNSSLNAQTVMVDDFSLIGPGPDFASWMAQFSAENSLSNGRNPLPASDLDGDGVVNFDEWVAGTSAGESNDCLRLTVEPAGHDRARLRWNTIVGRTYNVWKSTELSRGFSRMAADIAAPPSAGQTVFEDANAKGSVFYKLEVKTVTP